MRSLSLCFAALMGPALAATGCFDPNLGEEPFFCAPTGKPCPDDYVCGPKNLCVRGAESKDAGVDIRLTDAQLEPSKDGPVFLDGSVVLPANNCIDTSTEPNNTQDSAFELLGTGLITGWDICYAGDVDHYSITLKAGQKLSVTVEFTHDRGDIDAALLDPDGLVVRQSRSEDDNEKLDLGVIAKDGTYTVGVYGFGKAENYPVKYDLRIDIQ